MVVVGHRTTYILLHCQALVTLSSAGISISYKVRVAAYASIVWPRIWGHWLVLENSRMPNTTFTISSASKVSWWPNLNTFQYSNTFPISSDAKLIGFGNTELSIWNHNTGDLLMSIDFKLPLGRNISIFEFKNQVRVFIFFLVFSRLKLGSPFRWSIVCSWRKSSTPALNPTTKILKCWA